MSRTGLVPWLLAAAVLLVVLVAAPSARAGVWTLDSLPPLVGPQSQATADGILYTDACLPTAFCMALGVDDTGGLNRQVTLEEVYEDGTWTQETGPPGFKAAYPAAMSCSSSTYCMAVSSYGGTVAVWNGASWAAVSGPSRIVYSAVSCHATTCVALGTRGSALVPSAELWRNGVPRRIAAPIQGLVAESIYCGTSSRCIAAGDYVCPESGPCPRPRPFAESWNGRSWKVMNGADDPRNAVDQFSCLSLRWCLGLGGGHSARWNGRSWQRLGPAPSWHTSLSCATQTSCEVVGQTSRPTDRNDFIPVAGHWDGHAWTRESVPINAANSQLRAVGCPSATLCTAVGDTGKAVQLPFAESWQPG